MMTVPGFKWAALFGAALALSACETVSDLNPFSKEDILPGEREALFDNADPMSGQTQARSASEG